MRNGVFKTSAPAKINLHLKVVGKRADGYHEIETLFHPLPRLADEVELEVSDSPAGSLEVLCDHPEAPGGESNICFKAAVGFAEAAGIAPSWRIRVRKRVPVAAGLGGGSSDAAAVLRLLNDNVERLPDELLRRIALATGADVPFFLDPRPAVGRGLGEILEPVDSKLDFSVLIVDPKFPVSAAWAYQHRVAPRSPNEGAAPIDESAALAALRSGDLSKLPETIENDLAPALLRKFPLLRILLKDLAELSPLSRGVTGSGPTLFALFADAAAAESAAALLADRHENALNLITA